uniref:Uncharacterized protein n=1 Tax=Oryza glumipatula TaxID=40148 RepID=A0A0E0B9J2_9ORYZ
MKKALGLVASPSHRATAGAVELFVAAAAQACSVPALAAPRGDGARARQTGDDDTASRRRYGQRCWCRSSRGAEHHAARGVGETASGFNGGIERWCLGGAAQEGYGGGGATQSVAGLADPPCPMGGSAPGPGGRMRA